MGTDWPLYWGLTGKGKLASPVLWADRQGKTGFSSTGGWQARGNWLLQYWGLTGKGKLASLLRADRQGGNWSLSWGLTGKGKLASLLRADRQGETGL